MQSLFKTVDVEAIQFFFFSLSLLALQYPKWSPTTKMIPRPRMIPKFDWNEHRPEMIPFVGRKWSREEIQNAAWTFK